MPDYQWPAPEKRKYIGKRLKRVDGPVKSTGRAKYTYDIVRPGMLYGVIVRSPLPRARIKSIDVSAAQAMPGVKAIEIVTQGPNQPSAVGRTIQWAGDELVALAAVDERTAYDAARAVKIEFDPLPFNVDDKTEPPHELKPDTGPLTQTDLQDMIVNQVPNAQVVSAIQTRGVAFPVTPELLKQLPGLGVAPAIVDALSKAEQKPPQEKPASWYRPAAAQVSGDPDGAFKQDGVVTHEGFYGIATITHCCLESHGAISEWPDAQHIKSFVSTQAVSAMPGQLAQGLAGFAEVPASNINVHQDHIGGGFGSKFSIDRWGVLTAKLSKKAGGKPVKIMLERKAELEVAGSRPSAYANVKVAATKDGQLLAWDSFGWGTGGPGGGGSPPLPYVFEIPNQRKQWTAVVTHQGPARAWRAPNHPQAAQITMSALEDLATKLNMDPVKFFLKNIDIAGANTPRPAIYKDELAIADELMGWSQRWHPRGDKTEGPIKRGLGLSMHTWGGRGHPSECDLLIHPDGSVELKMGTQDLGTGTRTCILAVVADTLGIPMEQIKLLIGDTQYPTSGGSGGSTTIGGVSASSRRAAVDARDALFAKVAPALGTTADKLESVGGRIAVAGTGGKSLTWKEACAKIGPTPISAHGVNKAGMQPDLTNSGVGGVMMADASVDVETGVVKVNKMVAVQDCGLIIDLKTAESQTYGAMIMGVSYALYEERILDPVSGRMLNPNMEFYRLAGIGDIPDMVVHMMVNKYDQRGVIGLGEPPVVSPGAAIANAVANAIGVRVPTLPLTPDRVLAALEKQGGANATI